MLYQGPIEHQFGRQSPQTLTQQAIPALVSCRGTADEDLFAETSRDPLGLALFVGNTLYNNKVLSSDFVVCYPYRYSLP